MRIQEAMRFTVMLVCLQGCGSGIKPPPEPTGYRDKIGAAIPLTGQVSLDGTSSQKVIVSAMNEQNLPMYKQQKEIGGLATGAAVKPDGSFSFTTFENGDGLPAGNYIVLFRLPPRDDRGGSDPKTDAFNRKYGNPETSKYKATLEAGKPVDLGKVELSTK